MTYAVTRSACLVLVQMFMYPVFKPIMWQVSDEINRKTLVVVTNPNTTITVTTTHRLSLHSQLLPTLALKWFLLPCVLSVAVSHILRGHYSTLMQQSNEDHSVYWTKIEGFLWHATGLFISINPQTAIIKVFTQFWIIWNRTEFNLSVFYERISTGERNFYRKYLHFNTFSLILLFKVVFILLSVYLYIQSFFF